MIRGPLRARATNGPVRGLVVYVYLGRKLWLTIHPRSRFVRASS